MNAVFLSRLCARLGALAWWGLLASVSPACGTPVVAPGDAQSSDAPLADALPGDEGAGDAADARGPDAPAVACTPAAVTGNDTVRTESGTVRGVVDGDVRVFRAIPYAAPPVGALRFRAPIEPACWSDVRDATRFGPACPQLDEAGTPTGDESCLTLNVFAPTTAPESPLPVLFFVHGGGNNQGSSSVGVEYTGGRGVYDGSSLVRRGAVVVTVQYRLGALGFLSLEGLDRESPEAPSGTQGLRDVLFALRWVQRNIGRFGGDAARVMLFGESAGALDTMLLVSSPRAAGLFSRALSQSGGLAAMTREAARSSAARLTTGAGCDGASDGLACLRGKSVSTLLLALPQQVNGITGTDFGPAIDGDVLPESPIERVRAGRHNHVPMVYGTNSEETSRMVPPAAMVRTRAQFEALARANLAQYGLSAAQMSAVLAAYPEGEFSPHEALVALTTDTRWTCPARANLRALSSAQTEPAYRYFFTHRLDARTAPAASAYGAYHGLELLFVFGAVDGTAGYRATEGDRAVIDLLQSSWVRFAQTGSLSASGTSALAWPAYAAASDPYVELAAMPAARQGVRTARCDAIERALVGP